MADHSLGIIVRGIQDHPNHTSGRRITTEKCITSQVKRRISESNASLVELFCDIIVWMILRTSSNHIQVRQSLLFTALKPRLDNL